MEKKCDFKDYGEVERVCNTCGFVTIKTDKGVESDLLTTISDVGEYPQCHSNHNVWTLEEIIEELKSIDAFDSAKYFFDKYGN